MDFNLAVILRESARRAPGQAGGHPGRQPSSATRELDALSDRFARPGRAGRRPAIGSGCSCRTFPQFVVAYFGILKAGGVVVPMNVLLKAPEIAYQLRRLGRAGADHLRRGSLAEAAKAAADAAVTALYFAGTCREVAAGASLRRPAGRRSRPARSSRRASPADPAVIIYTSGTTGTPKGAELSHFPLYMNADMPGRLFGFCDDDVVLVALPLFHVFGLSSRHEHLRAARRHDVAGAAIRGRRGARGRSSATGSRSSRACRRCTSRCSRQPAGRLRPAVAAGRDLRRRADPGGGHRLLRAQVRHRRSSRATG